MGRAEVTTYIRDGAGLLIRSVTSSPWTAEDRALMLAWREYQETLCSGCGHPKLTAWHHHSEDSFEKEGDFVCWACTAANPPDESGKRELKKYPVVTDTRDYDRFPLKGAPEPLAMLD